ncbi:hypothetical protein GCM10027614_26570 [Micromonospora vulcania]
MHRGVSSAVAAMARSTPGSSSWTAPYRPERIAWDAANAADAPMTPSTVITPVTTTIFALITARRAGTTAKVVRISPVAYSPPIAITPMLPAASTTNSCASSGNASQNGFTRARRSAG